MFVVLDGQAGLSCVGCEYPLCTYSPGEAFGEIDAMQGRPRSSATTAVTACGSSWCLRALWVSTSTSASSCQAVAQSEHASVS